MRISQLLSEGLVNLKLKGKDRVGVIDELVDMVHAEELIGDPKFIASLVVDRERIHPTGIGRGLAIPHARVEDIDGIILAAGRHAKGVDFEARDGKPARLVFLILAPEDDTTLYLQALSSLAMMLTLGDLPERLLAAKTPAEFIDEIRRFEEM